MLRGIENRRGLAGCLADARDPARRSNSYADMIAARLSAIACGYEDCDDLDVLRFDPAFKLACARLSKGPARNELGEFKGLARRYDAFANPPHDAATPPGGFETRPYRPLGGPFHHPGLSIFHES